MYHIVVAEDELWIRNSIIELIEQADEQFKVVGDSGNGEDAWALVTELCPNILVTDIRMPKQDGLWLIRQIHEHAFPVVPVIISGFDDFEYARQAIKYGVSEYLLKPIERKELQEALKKAADRYTDFRDIRDYFLNIQAFIDEMDKLERHKLNDRLRALLKSIWRLKGPLLPKRDGILRLFAAKLKDAVRVQTGAKPLPELRTASEEEIFLHFYTLLEQWSEASRIEGKSVKENMRIACEHINANYMKNATLSAIAEICCLSESHFRFLFKQHTGMTFVHYLNQVRIQAAKQLLLQPDLKVYQIGEMVGLPSQPHFIRVFRNETGKTPTEYRKQMGVG